MSTVDIKTVYAAILAHDSWKCIHNVSFVLVAPDQDAERLKSFGEFAGKIKSITQATSVEIVNMQSLTQGASTVVQVNGVYRGRKQEYLFFDSIQFDDTAIVKFNSTLKSGS